MEFHAQLDPIGRSANRKLIFLAVLFFLLGSAHSQTLSSAADKSSEVKNLYDQGRWSDVVGAVPRISGEPADLVLYRGLALAQLRRLPEAEETFRAGLARYPRDTRFLTELAGIAYREKRFARAKTDLRRVLILTPQDDYANNFLASIYFLEGNFEAALKYWNRVKKPVLDDLIYHPQPGLDPILLDRAFEFSKGNEWRRDQFLTTRTKLESLDLFPQMRFDLATRKDGSFDLGFYTDERSRWSGRNLESLASMLRGLPYQSVYPEFYDLNHEGLNWLSFVRWDDEKRRLSSEVSAPMAEGPQERFRIYFDGRNENWNISRTLVPAVPSPADMNMERAVAGAEIKSIMSWRWQWNVGAEYSYRKFRNLAGIPAQAAPFFIDTSGITLRTGARLSLIRFPERRFTLDSGATGEFGKFYTDPLGRYGRIKGSLAAHWLPKARGEDYETQTKLRAAHAFGQIPFDDLFTFGFDRDNDLWMRGHDGLADGKKGNGPLGRNFVLSNSEIDKIVYKDAFFTVKLGPFFDTGDIYDPSGFFGSPKWLSDTGVQAKIGLLDSFQFVLGYGKDLRSGNNTFYTTVSR